MLTSIVLGLIGGVLFVIKEAISEWFNNRKETDNND